MSYVEEILMPQVIAELARLHGDPEVIRRCTEIATGVPTAPIVLPSGPVAADVLTSGTATPEPPAPVEVVPEVAALPVTEAVPDPPAPPLSVPPPRAPTSPRRFARFRPIRPSSPFFLRTPVSFTVKGWPNHILPQRWQGGWATTGNGPA